MSDLQKRNTEAMIAAAERFDRDVCELKNMVVAQNHKIATLTNELQSIKEQMILAKVQAQLDIKGHGGTAT